MEPLKQIGGILSKKALATANKLIERTNALQAITGSGDTIVTASAAGYIVGNIIKAPTKPVWFGKIVSAGPNKEPDFTNALYWVQEELIAVNPDAVQPTTSPYEFYDKPALNYNAKANPETDPKIIADYKIWPVFNISEHFTNPAGTAVETHSLALGTIVTVMTTSVIETDSSNPTGNTTWTFAMAVQPDTRFVQVVSNYTTAGIYNVQSFTPQSPLTISGTTALLTTAVGTATNGILGLAINLTELGKATSGMQWDLSVGSLHIAKAAEISVDGKGIWWIEAYQSSNC